MNERDIFIAALHQRDPAGRAALLHRNCAGDQALRDRVEELLREQEQLGSFLERPAEGLRETGGYTPPAGEDAADLSEKPGTVIGPYKLMEQIGEGGFGVVFMAEQTQPVRRKVALKILKPGMDTRQVVARFEAERQALALMDHPNIARVLDGGQTSSGRPYFVMDLVKGLPITDYCDQAQLTPRERLELCVHLCQAVQHAHQKGIIHRDLKPSNVLVTLHDGTPRVKVIDFGIAKALGQSLTDKTVFTGFAQMVGTPLYMSPEQAALSNADVDTRSDIYSLGVLLYELLTGTTPFDNTRLKEVGYDELRRIIREEEPPRPSARISTLGQAAATVSTQRNSDPKRLSQLCRGELDWIVMKCLEKDRNRRYETANGFAQDIQRYLADEPVLACPPSATYRFRKFARRNKGVLVSVSGVAAAVLAAVVVLAVGNVRISEEKQRKDVALQQRSAALEAAQESHRDAQEQLFKALLNQARAGRFSRQMGQRMDSLDALAKAAVLHSDERLRDEAIAALALPDIRLGPTWQALPPGWTNPTFDGAYRLLARCNAEGVLSVRTVPADEEVRRIPSSPTTAWLALSPDGRFLAKGDEGGTLRVWRVSDGQPVLHDAPLSVSGIAFSPDGRHLAALQGVWGLRLDLATGRETNRWRLPQTGSDLAFHPDGRKLAVAWSGSNTGVTVFDSETGKIIADLAVGSIGEPHLAWHPDGERLAVGGTDARIQLWDVDARRRLATLEGHGQNITQVRLHPDGDLLASDSWDAVMRLWDPATGRPLMQVPFTTVKLRFSSDGRWLGVAWHGEQAQLLEVVPSREYRTLPCSLGAGQGGFYGGDISPDGRLLALGMEDGVRLWDLSSGRELARLPVARAWSALFRPDGRELLTSGPAGLYRWPIQEGGAAAPEVRLGPRRPIALPGSPDRVARSHDGRTLAVVIEGGGVALLVDSATGAVRGPQFSHPSITWVALSPEGKWVATSGWHSNRVRLWDADTGKMVHEWVLGTRATVYFTPDGRALIIGRDDEFSFWDVETRQPLRTLRRDAPQWPGNIAFSSDGKLMALEMAPGILHLKDVATGRTVSRLADPHGDRTVWLAFTPDGTRLVTVAGYAKAVHVWDLRAIRARLKEIDLDWEWPAFSAAEDGDTCPPRYSAPKPRVVVADPKGHLSLGNALSAKGQLAEAVVEYSKATELDPKYAYAHFCLGQALYGKGQLDKAIAEYQEAIHLKPNYGCAFSKLGLALHGKGLVDEAIAACKEGVRLGPAEHVDHHINLGMVLTRKGLTGEAIACYRRAIEVAPKNARILNDLSWLLATCSDARFRDPVRAVELAKNAVAMRREDGTIWKTLGAAHYRAGNWKEAVAALEKSMELRQGGNSYDWFFLAMAHWQLGERKTPRDWYDKAVKWMDQNQPKNEELRLFRAEAAGLLKIEPKKK